MASDITLRVFDPATQTVVLEAWLGGNGTRDRVRAVLARPPDVTDAGWESWGAVSAAAAMAIAQARYAHGASPEDVHRWLVRYPTADYWWIIEHDH